MFLLLFLTIYLSQILLEMQHVKLINKNALLKLKSDNAINNIVKLNTRISFILQSNIKGILRLRYKREREKEREIVRRWLYKVSQFTQAILA